MKYPKDIAKTFIKNIGIDRALQVMIEIIDDNIDATEHDMESLENSNDLWKFRVADGLEYAYHNYINRFKDDSYAKD